MGFVNGIQIVKVTIGGIPSKIGSIQMVMLGTRLRGRLEPLSNALKRAI